MNNTLAMWARDYRDAVDLGNAPDYGTPTVVSLGGVRPTDSASNTMPKSF